MKLIRGLWALCALAFLTTMAPLAHAQTVSAVTVSNCGTPINSPVVNVPYPLTQDTTGKLCTSSTGGGGSSYTVTGGSAGGLANLFTPAGGSDGTNYRMLKLDPSTQNLLVYDATVATALGQATPAGSNTIGNTNGFQGSSGPWLPPAGDTNFVINATAAATTKVITGTASKKTYIAAFHWSSVGAGTVKWVSGTGTNCGTGTTALSNPETAAAGSGFTAGNGLGAVLIAAAAQDVCVTTTSAATADGAGTFAQF